MPSILSLILWTLLSLVATYSSTSATVSAVPSPDTEYLKHQQMVEYLNQLRDNYTHLVELSSIGKSVQNRELMTIAITNRSNGSTTRQVLKPMFKYVANIHGNEALGRQLLLMLAKHLCDGYGRDQRVTRMLDTTEVHLMPSLNPDGFESAKEGDCFGAERLSGRQNAHNVDLNRDFPDQFVAQEVDDSQRQPETLAAMTWIVSNPFVLSAALHGGSVVASYPYDDSPKHIVTGHKSPTPDDELFLKLAKIYAENHKTMRNGSVCLDDNFKDGITNGADWYDVPGGMQDFNYVRSNCYEITLELSCCKYPKAGELSKEWLNNKESLLSYIEMVQMGVKGLVKDSVTGNAIEGAVVRIDSIDHNVTTTSRGEYWRLALPGVYKLTASAVGYESLTKQDVVVKTTTGAAPLVLDFLLNPIGGHRIPSVNTPDIVVPVVDNHKSSSSQSSSTSTTTSTPGVGALQDQQEWHVSVHNQSVDHDFRTKTEYKHHNYTEMRDNLKALAAKYPKMTRLYSVGQSTEHRDLWVLEISVQPGVHRPGVPEFKYVANMHGNEVIGRELLLLFAKYLLENYGLDNRITELVDKTRIHLMPSMNPDGYERSLLGDCNSEYGRGNAHKVDLNRNFPDQYSTFKENRVQEVETLAMMKWIQSEPFVLSANLHGGSLVANYPYDGNPMHKDGIYSKTPDDVLFRHLALVYSINHATMHLGKSCPIDCGIMNENFTYGITNGAEWYALYGGMQDWNYLHSNCFELTLELGCRKYPYESDIKEFWRQNKKSLVVFAEEVHKGVKGFVVDTDGHSVPNATIRVEGIAHDVHSAKDGDYWRLLIPGTYRVTVFKQGFAGQTQTVVITNGLATQINFTLEAGYDQWSEKYDFGISDNLEADHYVDNNGLHETLELLAKQNPNVVKIFSNRAPNKERVLHFLTVSDFGDNHVKDKPNVVLIGGIHGDQPVGRELLLRFVRHLVDGYKRRDPRVVHLLQSLTLHVIPSVDDQGFQGSTPGVCNRSLDSNDDLEDKFAEEFTNKFGSIEALKKNFLVYKYVTGLSLESYGLRVRFPLMINSDDLDGQSLASVAYKALSSAYITSNPMLANGVKCDNQEIEVKYKKLSHIHNAGQSLLDYGFGDHKSLMMSALVDCCSYPLPYELPKLWKNNLESIMSFLETSLTGITGYVLSATNTVPKGVSVMIDGFEEPVDIDPKNGKFYLVLNPGVYTVHFSAPGYENKSLTVNVKTNENQIMNVILDSIGLSMTYHSYDTMAALLANFTDKYPEITSLFSIGESVQKRKILVFRIGSESKRRGAETANIRFIGGLQGHERATTEVLIQLVDYLLSRYRKDTFITQLIDMTHIYVLPMANPDGAELAQLGKCDSIKGLANARDVDLDQSFLEGMAKRPPETLAIMEWTKRENFLVSVTMRTGGNVVTYPFSSMVSNNRLPLSEIDKQSFEHLANIYSKAHRDMHLGSARCGHSNRNRLIKNGFTTGSIWHPSNGTLQDYGFNTSNVYELYVYIGCCGSPPEGQLAELWRDHKAPVLELLNNVNNGIHGRVVDENGAGIPEATILVESIAHKVYVADKEGHYRIPLYEGKYVLTIEAPGYWPSTKMATIFAGQDNLFVIDMMSDTRIAGIPRAVFVIIVGSAVLTVLIVSLCVYNVLLQQKYHKKGFQRIGANGVMFADSDEEEEDDEEVVIDGTSSARKRPLVSVKEYKDNSDDSEDELYNVHKWKGNPL